ncbi:SDR family NAD(P)-dependent oxidoreductase [Tsukamurella ocularis]|uniref:SDR family NAD(P)-dependent oxidoreductase n=1 Tax=Tsukamurella ocularis TaxID=1970234 RepID=UPI0039EE8E3E
MTALPLAGRTALITGAAGALGSATARRLARDGAAVLVTDILTDGAEHVAAQIRATGGRAEAFAHDVTDSAQWRAAIGRAEAAFGGLSILVNNAGIGNLAPIDELSVEGYDRVVAITQTSVFLGMKYACEALRRSGHGAVINISSICGVTGTTGRSFGYHAAKGAVGQMTKNAAIRWAQSGIRVNSIHPGYIATPGVLAKGEYFVNQVTSAVPMARLGEPDEIAAAVAFLAGDEATFITGAELHVDGGFLAR